MSLKELVAQEIRTVRELRYLRIEFDPECRRSIMDL